jgi:outer membrane protein TolC
VSSKWSNLVLHRKLARRVARSAFTLGLAVAATGEAQTSEGTPQSYVPLGTPFPIKVLTLPEAIAYARAHQPSIRLAVARVAAEEQSAKIPGGQWFPSVGVTAQLYGATANNTTGTFLNEPFVDAPRIGGTSVTNSGSMKPYPATFVGGGFNQEVFDFGRIAAQTAAADALVDLERHRSAAERLYIDYNVEEAYLAVYAAKSVLRAAGGALERSRVHRDLAKAGVGAGLRSPIELTRAEADYARFRIGWERAGASVTVAQNVLAASVGVPDPVVDVAETAPAVREMPSMAQAIQDAAARDPRILEAQARVRALEQATKAIATELRPNLGVTSSISLRAGGAPASSDGPAAKGGGWAPDVPNWDIGLILSWPIFNGVIAARERASREREQVERESLGLVRYQSTSAIQQAFIAVQIAKVTLPALQSAVDAARANYEQADARFKSGIGNAVELADAEGLRTQADIDLALGQFELARARVALGRAIAEEP